MIPASNRGAGMNIGFPDVCLTPAGPAPVPLPYPNMAMNAMAAPFAVTVKLTMMPALNMASMIPLTMGDEAGVAHPFFKQRGAYTMGNPIVLVEKLPGICLMCPTTGNNMNNPLGAVLVPSVTNVFFTLRPDEEERAQDGDGLSFEDLAALERRLAEGNHVSDSLEGRVGTLRIAVFASCTPSLVYRAVRRLEAAGMKELVLDLRGNPGGDLDACVALLTDFCEPGSTLFLMEEPDGDRRDVSTSAEQLYRMPLEVLVDASTGSAAELFAAAIQDTGRGRITGERTYGKGVGRRISPHHGSPLEMVAATFYRRDGAPIHGVGVTPDLRAAP